MSPRREGKVFRRATEKTGIFIIPPDVGNRTLEVKSREDGSDDEARFFASVHRNRLTSIEFPPEPCLTTTVRVIELEYDALNQQIARRVHEDGISVTVPDQERNFVYENGQIALEETGTVRDVDMTLRHS